MTLRAVALDWSFDGAVGIALLMVVVAVGAAYLAAAARGCRRDRRHRTWSRTRSSFFVGGLVVLVVDLYSGIGAEADVRLSVHTGEHMVMWVVVAPLLAASARWLSSRPASTLIRPGVTVLMFSGVLLLSHVPAIYGLTLRNDYVHETEHGLYLFTAVLMWASLLGVDPLPHRARARRELGWMVGCMLPMALIALWLAAAPDPVYGHYLGTLGRGAIRDQRLTAMVMFAGGLPAFLVPALTRPHVPTRRRARQPSLSGGLNQAHLL
jgi:cytochrome c oxidase assembly factor CtaG